MSDLFHTGVPDSFIYKIFKVMKQANWHCFQVLTKRSARLKNFAPKLDWPKNVWVGVSVENEETKYQIDDLRRLPAEIKFLSIEPLLGPLSALDLNGLHWVIVGGESGPRSREIKQEWVLQMKEQCIEQNVPFFFEQWGGVNKMKAGRILQGRTWDDLPINTNISHKNNFQQVVRTI